MKNTLIALILLSSTCFCDVLSTDGKIRFDIQMDGQPEMTLNSTGLAIGALLPSSNLHVNGNAIISEQLFVGGSSGSSNLNVNGTIGYSIQNVISDTVLGESSMVFVDSSSDNITITLPYAANVTGRIYTIKKTQTDNSVQLTSATNTIDSSSYYILSSGNLGCIEVLASSDGNWKILSSIEGVLVLDPWSPSDLTTDLWFDANDSATVQVGASDNVDQWDDKSGGGNDFTQGLSSDRPKISTSGLGGLNSILLDGDDSLKSGTFVTNMDNIEVYIVFQANVLTNAQLFDIRSTGITGIPLLDDGSRDGFSTRRRNDAATLVNTPAQSKDTNAHLGYYAYDAVNDLLLNRLDGKNELTWASTSTTTGDFFFSLGFNGKSAGTGFNGWVGEVIMITSVSSISTRQKIEGYLAHKWNLTSSLSADHPYKTIAPYGLTEL